MSNSSLKNKEKEKENPFFVPFNFDKIIDYFKKKKVQSEGEEEKLSTQEHAEKDKKDASVFHKKKDAIETQPDAVDDQQIQTEPKKAKNHIKVPKATINSMKKKGIIKTTNFLKMSFLSLSLLFTPFNSAKKEIEKPKETRITMTKDDIKYFKEFKDKFEKVREYMDNTIGGTLKKILEGIHPDTQMGQLKKTKDRNFKGEKAKLREGKGP